MSLHNAEINVGRAFCDGQVYVALSRVRSLEGLALLDFNAAHCRASPLAHRYLQEVPAADLTEWAARLPLPEDLPAHVLALYRRPGYPDVQVVAAAPAAAAAPLLLQPQGAAAGLPPCKYGKSCYRKNPVHFLEFSHP